jgi:hypothetical protein
MKTKITLLLCLVNTLICTYGQIAGNALNFNATNSYCTASLPTVFNNIPSNDFTIEFWVNRESNTNTQRVFFAQKDQNNFCTILINSKGTPYFYVYDNGSVYCLRQNPLPINQWNHLAFTWDASTNSIVGYRNGELNSTIITTQNSSFGNNNSMTIGARTDGQQLFKGTIDELRIWNDLRTPCEIYAGANNTFTTTQPNLVASYSFNQGIANGTNTGVTTLNELNNNYNATLNGFVLSGTSSNWVNSAAAISQTNNNSETQLLDAVISACVSHTWIDGNTYTENNNTATYTYTGSAGCNITETLNLTVTPSATATNNNNVLTANQSGGIYQWVDCNNGNSPISEETNQSFTPTESGNYAVEVTLNSCTTISECINITTLELSENDVIPFVKMYPNPTNDVVYIKTVQSLTSIEVYDLLGKRLIQKTMDMNIVNVSELSNGVYNVMFYFENGKKTSTRLSKF